MRLHALALGCALLSVGTVIGPATAHAGRRAGTHTDRRRPVVGLVGPRAATRRYGADDRPHRQERAATHRRAVAAAVRVYLTTADLTQALTRQPDLLFAPAAGAERGETTGGTTIVVDDRRRYQRIDGFGGAMTDTSAWLLTTKLAPAARTAVLRRLFDPAPDRGIGVSFLRVPMAASDFTRDGQPYSYDDMAPGHADPTLAHFSIRHDLPYIILTLRAAMRLNPALKVVANPWSPPGWMKQPATSALSGALRPASYPALAAYFVAFIQAYRAHGVPIDAVTPQNEPGYAVGYPGVSFPAGGEARFIADALGPALARAGLRTRILAYDSFWDPGYAREDYPFLVAGDARARAYLAGTAWHCYWGTPDTMTTMHDAYPRLDVYETECASGIAHGHGDAAAMIIAATRNWARGALLWNLAVDTRGGPREGGGCPGCIAPVTIDQGSGRVRYTSDYYQLGQASAFVRPGAYRVASTSAVARYGGFGGGCASGVSYGARAVDDVAFANPDGSIALLTYNPSRPRKTFTVHWGARAFHYTLPPCATATFVWRGTVPPNGAPHGKPRVSYTLPMSSDGIEVRAQASSGAAVSTRKIDHDAPPG